MESLIRRIADAGFSHIHWCHEWEGNYLYADSEMEQIAQWIRSSGLKVKGVHATEGAARPQIEGRYRYVNNHDNRKDYTSANEYNRRAGVELVANRMRLAAALDAGEIVLHMQLPWKQMRENEVFKEAWYGQVFRSLDELKPLSRETGIRIALENLMGPPQAAQTEQFDRLFERYGASFLGFCFDPGHGLIMSEGDPLFFADRYRSRLIALHLNDNRGATAEQLKSDLAMAQQDLHMIPFQGSLDWDRICDIIAASPYELPVTMELSCREKESVFLKKAARTGERLEAMVRSRRENPS
jgi:sugar phosphate isomerase/epimerase